MSKKLPFVSIIVIVYNMRKFISDCLKSLKTLNYPSTNYEIIVVDGGSTDGTLEVVKDFGLKCIVARKASRGISRNIGIKLAKGEIVAFIDADCEASKDWLMIHTREHSRYVVAVGGSIVNPSLSESNKFSIIHHFEEFAEFDEKAPKRFTYFIPTNNASFQKHILSNVGFFDDVHTREDFLLCKKIVDAGYKILFDPAAKVLHYGYPYMSSRNFLRKEIRKGKIHFNTQKVNKKVFGRLPMQPVLVIFLTPSIVLARIVREFYKIKYTSYMNQITYLVPYIVFSGIIWSYGYIKEALINRCGRPRRGE